MPVLRKTYKDVRVSNNKLTHVIYTFGKGAEIHERAEYSIINTHSLLLRDYKDVNKANRHIIKILNDVEERIMEEFGENPFKSEIKSKSNIMKILT